MRILYRLLFIILIVLVITILNVVVTGSLFINQQQFVSPGIIKSTLLNFLFGTYKYNFIILLFFNIFVIIILGLYFSHQIAGPVYRLEYEIERIGKGDLSREIKLRKGDFLKEIAASLNVMQDTLKYRLKNIKDAIEEYYIENKDKLTPAEKEKLDYLRGLVEDLVFEPQDENK
jgi:methyl-accepting chemotaxis protein